MNNNEYGLFLSQVIYVAEQKSLACRGRPLYELYDVSILMVKLVKKILSKGWKIFYNLVILLEKEMLSTNLIDQDTTLYQYLKQFIPFYCKKQDVMQFLFNNKSFLFKLKEIGVSFKSQYVSDRDDEYFKNKLVDCLINKI